MQNKFNQELGQPVKNWAVRSAPHLKPMSGYYCRLEPLVIEKHAIDLFDAFDMTEKASWTYLPFGPFENIEQLKRWLIEASQTKIIFAIFDLKSNKALGSASYHSLDIEHGVAEVGAIQYSKQLKRTRIATEAMYLMMRHIFDDLGYRRYQWRCNSLNQASRTAALRLGFQYEGILRQTNVFKERNRDTAWFSIIDSEWPTLKQRFEKWLNPANFDTNDQQILKLQQC